MVTYGKLTLLLPGGLEQEFILGKTSAIVGRGLTNDIVLSDSRVSRQHASLECGPAGCTIVDLGSANGTQVNGVGVQRAALSPGDVITLGNSLLRLSAGEAQMEPDATIIDSEADLDATLAHAALPMTINETSQPRLVVHTSQSTWETPLGAEILHIGRQPGSEIAIDSERVSHQHARIERRGEKFVLRDLGSANGTWLGDRRVEELVLSNGDVFAIGPAQIVFKSGFAAQDLTVMDVAPAGQKRSRRPVVFVPGFMGSELWLGSERIWPNIKHLFSNPDIYRLNDNAPIQARGLLGEAVIVPNLIKLEPYNRLGDYLVQELGYTRGVDLMEFAYDWRQDVRISAQLLAQAIAGWNVQPVTLLAHGLGTLVSRYYVECLGGKSQVERMLLLGGPHNGFPKAVTSLLLGPDLLPFGLLGEGLRQIMATFPSSYQVLPSYPCAIDQTGQPVNLLEDECWLSPSQIPQLHLARLFRQELGSRSSVHSVSIFGYGLKTVMRIFTQRDSRGAWRNISFEIEPGGDSTVPESSAILEGTEIYPVQQYHGTLYTDNDVKMRLKLELTRQTG